MRVSAAIPANVDLNVQYIYYQTSEYEELVGGKKANYEGIRRHDPATDETVIADVRPGVDFFR